MRKYEGSAWVQGSDSVFFYAVLALHWMAGWIPHAQVPPRFRWEEPGEQHCIRRLRSSSHLGHPPPALGLAVPRGGRKAETSGPELGCLSRGDGGDNLRGRTAAAAAGGAGRLVVWVVAAWQGCG